MDDNKKLNAQSDYPDLEALFVHIRNHKEQVTIEHEEIETQVKVLIHQKQQLDHSKKYLEVQENVLEDLRLRSRSIRDRELALAEQEAGLDRLKESLKIEKIAFDLSNAEFQVQYQLVINKGLALDKQTAELQQKSETVERDEKALQVQQEEFNKRFINLENKERVICHQEVELDQQSKKLRDTEKSIQQQKSELKHRMAMLNDKEAALRLRETEINRREKEFEKMRKEFESNHHTVRLPGNARIQIIQQVTDGDSTKAPTGTVSIKPVSVAKMNEHIDGIVVLCHICGRGSDNFGTCDHCKATLKMPLNIAAKPTPSQSGTSLESVSSVKNATEPAIKKEVPASYRDCKTYAKAPKYRKIEAEKSESEKKTVGVTKKYECDKKNIRASQKVDNKPIGISVTCKYETRGKPAKSASTAPTAPSNENESPVTVSLHRTSILSDVAINEQNDPPQKVDFSTFLRCKKIKIGSYDYTPSVGVLMSSYGIRLTAPLLKNNKCNVTISLKSADLKRILVNFDEAAPVFFIYTTPEAGTVIRRNLGMKERNGPYFDPVGKEQAHRRIILFPENFMEESKNVLRNMYKAKFEELNKNEANRFLTKATFLNNDESKS